MAKSGAERIKEHRQRKIAKGFKEVTVWVPAKLAARLQAYAKRLCKSET